MKMTKCDRCYEEELGRPPWFPRMRGQNIWQIKITTSSLDDLDLCSKCHEELRKIVEQWFAEENKK